MNASRIPPGSLVLVTGAGGLIGSSVAEAFLANGYRVRGTSRTESNLKELKAQFDKRFGADKFEIAVVPDIAAKDAWTNAIKDVSAVIHLATDATFSDDYHKVVNTVVDATVGLLKASAATASVKSVVLTSSRISAFNAGPGEVVNADSSTWFEQAPALAQQDHADSTMKAGLIYAASKYLGERASWDYVKANKPHFTFNAILPDYVIGQYVNATGSGGSTHGWLRKWLEAGDEGFFRAFVGVPSLYVDVKDVALLHLAAAVDSDVNGERIWAAVNAPWGSKEILQAAAEVYPDRQLPADLQDLPPRPKIHVNNARGEELLKRHGRPGWRTLKEAVKDNLA